MLLGYDDDLAAQSTAGINRIRGVLTQIYPRLAKALEGNVSHAALLYLLIKAGGPTGLRKMEKTRITAALRKHAPRIGERLSDQIWTALDQQAVVVPGTTAAEKVLSGLAEQLLGLQGQRRAIAREVDARSRRQDRSPPPGRSRRSRRRVPFRGPPRRLRRPGAGDPAIRHMDPR